METGNIQLIEPLIIPYRRTMVMLVDDQAMVAEAVRRLLADLPDIDLHYCSNGSQAVDLANRINPTVILQDLVMPDVEGLDLVGTYRLNPATADTPIIVLSSEENPEIKSNAFALGANDYLVKLPDRIELIARIRYHAKAHLNRIERNQAFTALRESQRQLMAANLELQRLSTVDALTGLKNRRFLDERIGDEWIRAIREKQSLSALLVDIDYFKQYNDTYGHLAGDEALKKVSEILGAHSRRQADCVARFGGEEFAVILPATNPEVAHAIGEVYRHGVENLQIPHPGFGICNVLTVSIGAATMVPRKGQPFSLLMNAADELMYQAKKAGKNRVVSRQEAPFIG